MSVIGMDIGHSAVKVSCRGMEGETHNFTLPSAVCRATYISDEAEAARAVMETVRVGSVDYFVGQTALIQGGANVLTGLNEDWIDTPEYSALMLAAFNAAKRATGFMDEPHVVMGLPTHLYSRQKEALQSLAGKLLNSSEIRVVPQPMGVYFELSLSENGVPILSVNNESWAIVEVGYFSTDIMLMANGRWVEKASGACSGVRVAAEHLRRILGEQGITTDLPECETALKDKFIKNFGQKKDVSADVDSAISILSGEVIDTAARLIEPFVRKLDGVIVAGGGAGYLFDEILARWPHAVCPHHPRMSVAKGMRRFASMVILKSALRKG